MKLLIICLFVCFSAGQIGAQMKVSFRQQTMTITDRHAFPEPIVYDALIQKDEGVELKMFKEYFNPSSFEKYKSFFLPKDWGGFSEAQFTEWQTRIKYKKLYLQQYLLVQDENSQNFIVYQYVMEDPAHSIYLSMILKKVNGAWKHVSLMNDPQAAMLKRIGGMELSFLDQKWATQSESIDLDLLQDSQQRTYLEKFDRESLFKKISVALAAQQIEQKDIDHARELFLLKDDQGMVEFLAGNYKMDEIDLMKSINAQCEFALFHFGQLNESK